MARWPWILGGAALVIMALEEKASAATPKKIGHVVSIGGRTLTSPIEYTIEEKFPGYVFYCDEFNIYGSGNTFMDALNELTSSLWATAQDIILADPKNMTPAGRAKRARWVWLIGSK